ncbi:MAG: glycosyltransferase [Candidatus Omnitrophica bacterium]|nr:glycosyltransferase [Candidatus Omnitrophota bacterium]
MKIAIFFDRVRDDTMGIYFERALRGLGFAVDHFWSREAAGIREGYDLYFRVDDDTYQAFPAHLRPQVFYVSDIHLKHVFNKVVPLAKSFDIVFTTMRPELAKLRKLGIPVYWLNVGCDPGIHKRLDLPKIYDIGYVGTSGDSPRKFILQALEERYPKSYIAHAYYLDMCRIYSQAKIGFSYAIRDECFTMRNFEIMSSGAMLLQHRLRDDSAEKLGYIEGKHYVVFDKPGELFGIIDHYLASDKEREAIAEAGYEQTRAHHTYQHSMREMLEVVKERLKLPVVLPEVPGFVPYHVHV